MKIKIGQKTNYFLTLRAPAPTDLWFSIVVSHWNAYYQNPKRITDAFLFLSNIFWIIWFWLFSFNMWFQNLSKYCDKVFPIRVFPFLSSIFQWNEINRNRASVKERHKNQGGRAEHMPREVTLNRASDFLKIAILLIRIVKKYMQ